LAPGTIIGHVEKILLEEPQFDISYLSPSFDRLEKIRAAFAKSGSMTLTPVREILGENYSFDEIRLGRLFLN
jgi:ATP-dependent DNA helicase RecQ